MLRIKTDGDENQAPGTVIIDVSPLRLSISTYFIIQTLKQSEKKSDVKVLTKKDVTVLYLNDR
jgi:hypothetical protein